MELTIKIKINAICEKTLGELLGKITQSEIQKRLDAKLNHYEDGRNDFNSEVIEYHTVGLVLSAIRQGINARNSSIYGNKMVPWKVKGMKGKRSKAIMETDKQMEVIKNNIAIFLKRDN